MSKKFIILIILIVAFIVFLGAAFLFISGNEKQSNDHSILVLLVDPPENSPGPGAVDFAFVLELKNYSITNLTTIYPTGPPMAHPTAAPNMEMNNLQIKLLYLHNALFDIPLNEGTKHAQEIVESNTGMKTDSVVIVRPEAVDAILQSIGGVDVNGSHITNNSIEFLRDEQYNEKISRPDIVKSVGYAIKDSSKTKRSALIQTITIQYLQGNIMVVPNDLFFKLISTEGIKSLFG